MRTSPGLFNPPNVPPAGDDPETSRREVEVMKGALIAAVLCVAGFLAGCTVTETAAEHDRRIRRQTDLQWRMFTDDLDAVLLLDRNTKLTDWYTHMDY
jgi:hypothetical protein